MKQIIPFLMFAYVLIYTNTTNAQHNNELYNDGALIHIQNGADIYIQGDVHMIGASADLENNGYIVTQGNTYGDGLFQQSGTGTYLVENSSVNTGERQFIQGNFRVRGTGTSNIGVDDGSFYNLELANDQGIVYIVGTGVDVRNTVDFAPGAGVQNRIITHDVGLTGAITYPTNGSNYTGVFGMMNNTAGTANFINNTVALNGNNSGVDAGYIQGNLRRAINPAGGVYGYVIGLEPAGAGSSRGLQYAWMDFGVNTYDVVTGYFQQGLSNTMAVSTECSGYQMDYFGGVDHGQWVMSDAGGSGNLEFKLWPQDHNMPAKTVWLVSRNNAILGTANDCGPTVVGLDRNAFAGTGTFGVVGSDIKLPVELLAFKGECFSEGVSIEWSTATEENNDYFTLERSFDGVYYETVATIPGAGTTSESQMYSYEDVGADGTAFYRLSQTDFDGKSETFTAIVINCAPNDAGFEVFVYPNPTTGRFNVNIKEELDAEWELTLLDHTGKLIERKTFSSGQIANVDIAYYANGMYLLKLQSGNKIVSKKILKHY